VDSRGSFGLSAARSAGVGEQEREAGGDGFTGEAWLRKSPAVSGGMVDAAARGYGNDGQGLGGRRWPRSGRPTLASGRADTPASRVARPIRMPTPIIMNSDATNGLRKMPSAWL